MKKMEIAMQKAQNVIKLLITIMVVVSCTSKSKTDSETKFLEFYFAEHFNTQKELSLNTDNSNIYIHKALTRYSEDESKQNDLIKKLLSNNGLKNIEKQTVNNMKWRVDIEKSIKNIVISIEDIAPTYVSKPVFCNDNNYCLIYSYSKEDEVYFIPSIEVFKNEGGWKKIGAISHFK